ncbi:MAG: NYN domain-containing protein [Candidatus Odinarchaeota archaeon]
MAIFWDYENIRAVAQGINVPLAEALINYSETIGHPRLKKAYSNWRTTSDTVIQALYSLGFEPIQVSMGKQNSVDVKLTVDCMSTVKDIPTIKHVIIVTGDKDYIPLVNWLKERRHHVIVIGQSDIVSEHLMLSADDFVSLEELPKSPTTPSTAKEVQTEETFIPFSEAVACLVEAISTARDQGKTTRFPVIDTTMRSNTHYAYDGVSSVRIQEDKEQKSFKTFSDFINAAEETGRVKIVISEGFKELFLPDEDPDIESDFSSLATEITDESHWRIILDQLELAFSENTDQYYYGRFGHLNRSIRDAKQDGRLPYSNKTIIAAMNKMMEIGILVKQSDDSFRLIESYETSKDDFLKKLSASKE